MPQETTLGHGNPGIASFASNTFGGPSEPRFGDAVPTTTHEVVSTPTALSLPIYSVVSVLAGVIALATLPGVIQGSATGTVTFSTATPADNDTVIIGGRTYTFKTALSVGPTVINQVLAGASFTAAAANLAAAINGSGVEGTNYSVGTVPDANVAATVAAGVVTLAADDPGDEGNVITLSKAGVNIAVSGATLAGGSDDPDALPFGILAHPIVMTNGQSMSVALYREGHWDMDQLNWSTGWSDEQKRRAFENSRSPNIFVSKKKFNNDQVKV